MRHLPSLVALALGLAACSSEDSATPVDDASVDETAPDATAETSPDGFVDTGTGEVTPLPDAGPDTSVDTGPIVATQPLSPFIVVDQFGYRPSAEKIAVLRSPKKGFDVGTAYTPGAKYAVVDAHTSKTVLEGTAKAWNSGATDASSGDQAWWFDFSALATPGDYFVLDTTANVRSDVFRVGDDVYREVLRQSVRMFYHQRDGIAKDAKYAGAAWADGAAHMGAGQGPSCGLYTDGSAKKDLHGGWYDAGDQNKYTNWAASDALELLRAYTENPGAFFDDYNLPESGNGVADVLDETKWELDWLVRMQNADGSVLSIVGQDGTKDPAFGGSKDTRPSLATGPCKYGPATTSASLTTAAAFAYASMVYKTAAGAAAAYPGFASDLLTRAQKAWDWAEAHPSTSFANAGKIGAGEQEVDDNGRKLKKLQAAALLFAATGDAKYRTFVDANYKSVQFTASSYVDCFDTENSESLLEYARATGATGTVVTDIKTRYKSGLGSAHNLGALTAAPDPFMAYLYVYTWGSNQVKSAQGNLLWDAVAYGVDTTVTADVTRAAERYVHYVHGVNPLQLVYLSNMGDYGANKSITRFYHSWFAKGSDWDAVGVSKYPPPPGYLVGGPNPSYKWDGCCPGGCSGFSCGPSVPSPPAGQPDQKAYKDFNDQWPLNSWEISEPSDGYQAKWVRLLSKYVK
ncbi:MAG: glycoside hydrolase family 9 protein [Myxococcales bacterium]|nr:glycoside hydrolase family 9 protein [Myxococcales bacterium]